MAMISCVEPIEIEINSQAQSTVVVFQNNSPAYHLILFVAIKDLMPKYRAIISAGFAKVTKLANPGKMALTLRKSMKSKKVNSNLVMNKGGVNHKLSIMIKMENERRRIGSNEIALSILLKLKNANDGKIIANE